jgi:Tfp pilus assembly protein PilN
MLTLNLVSQELKEEIKSRHIYELFKKLSLILIIVVIIIAIILLTAKLILQNSFNKIVEQTTLVTGSSKGYADKVRKINSKINIVAQIQDEYIAWSRLLESLAKITPNGVMFYSIKINREKALMEIKGRADTRDDLLILKENLKNTSFFYEPKLPIENMLQKRDVNFEIETKINLDYIAK